MFKKYIENEQFNLQINRCLGKFENNPQVERDIESILPILTDTDSWYKAWRKLAEKMKQMDNSNWHLPITKLQSSI